jgi:adenine-specific DNA methylase
VRPYFERGGITIYHGDAFDLLAGIDADVIVTDPPYSAHYARELYGFDYPRPSHLLREAARVAKPGARIGIVHYITPKPVPGTSFVKTFGLSTGFDMPMRAVTIYERDGAGNLFGAEGAAKP